MTLDMWIRGHLCRVHAYFEEGDRGGRDIQPTYSEFCIENVQPLDGTTLDISTLTDGEWNNITNTLWEDAADTAEQMYGTWEWFIRTDGPWNYEGDDLKSLDQQISAAHRAWRRYWL